MGSISADAIKTAIAAVYEFTRGDDYKVALELLRLSHESVQFGKENNTEYSLSSSGFRAVDCHVDDLGRESTVEKAVKVYAQSGNKPEEVLPFIIGELDRIATEMKATI